MRSPKEDPSKHWLSRRAWREGRIPDGSLRPLFWWGLAAVVGVVLPLRVGFSQLSEVGGDGRGWMYLFMTMGVLIGLGFLGRFGWLLWRLIRFGRSVFEMAEVPGFLGGTLGGLIHTRVHIPAEGGFRVQLENRLRQTVVTHSGNRRAKTVIESTIWEDEIWIEGDALKADRTRSAIPVYFEIPYECKATSQADPMKQFLWKLKVEADVPGVDYGAEFEVPLFRTEQSRSDFVARRRGGNALSAVKERGRDWNKAGIELGSARDTFLSFHNTPGYLYPYNYVGLGVGAVVCGVGAAMLLTQSGFPWAMGVVNVLLGGYFAWYALDLIFGLREVTAAPYGLHLHHQLLGYDKTLRFRPDEIDAVEVQQGNGVCRIVARLRASRASVTLTHYVRDYAAARELADRIEKILEMRAPRTASSKAVSGEEE